LVGYSQTEEQKELFIEAEYLYLYEDFSKALEAYMLLYQNDSSNANLNYRIGMSILHLSDNTKYKRSESIHYLEKSIEDITPEYNEGSYKETRAPYEAIFYLGNAYRFNHEFDKAILMYERFIATLPPTDYFYIDFVKRESQACFNAQELIQLPVNYQTENITSLVKSKAKIENLPVVNYNENVVIYTSGKNNTFSPDINMAAINIDHKMDNIYFTFFKDSVWSEPRSINEEMNAGTNVVPTSITGDGKTLFMVRDDNDNGNVYMSHYEDDEWSNIKKLNKNINSPSWESHISITEDGKTLFFTSDRPGGFGGLDVYKSDFDPKIKDWGTAVNLGPTINSIYDEETPYVVNNGRVLYFSSQGHYGMGGFDIFYSSLLDNGSWTYPLNLGYPLNTAGNDLFYLPRRNGEYAIFPLNSTDRPQEQANDLYRIKVPVPGTDTTEIELKGRLTLEDNNYPLKRGARIVLINNENQDTLKSANLLMVDGQYTCLISSGNFKVVFEAPGYESRVEYVLIPKIFAKTEFNLSVTLKPIAVSEGDYYVIKNVFFDYGKADLSRESLIEIEKLYAVMNENAELYVEVVGHTDSWSSADFNQKLSEKRSRSVIDYLVEKGLDSRRFVAVGKGKANPIAINENSDGTDNPEGRQLNRRVEIKLLNYNGSNIVVEEIEVPKQLKYSNQASSIFVTNSDEPLQDADFQKIMTKADYDLIFKNLSFKFENDLYWYYLNGYSTKADALKDLNWLLDKGFAKAHIVEKSESVANQTAPSVDSTITYFTLQIKALKQKVNPKTFTSLKGVEVHLGKDGFYRYVYGRFASREDALGAKQTVETDETLKDAFIVPFKTLLEY